MHHVRKHSISSLPTELTMPAEWAPHDGCIILYPHNPHTFPLEQAQAEVDEVIQIIAHAGKELVHVYCHDEEQASMVKQKNYVQYSDGKILIHVCPSNDTWARDTAPTFCYNTITKQLVGLDWEFNAYGGKDEGAYWPCDLDQNIASNVCASLGIVCQQVPLVLEGGAIHTDGQGTLLVTKECLLNPNRNPHLGRDLIEKLLKTVLGCKVVIWLPSGLNADSDTNGHVDNFCCFVKPGHVVLAWTDDVKNDPENYARCRVAKLLLGATKDARGRKLEIHKLYLPPPMVRSP